MSTTTDFIAELIRAANEADILSTYEISRLLDRSIDTIRDMREQTGGAGGHTPKDVLIDLRAASERVRDLSAEEIRDSLVDAANVIRTLKIALDAKE